MIIPDLEENTVYVFRVRARTSKGEGPYSKKYEVQTPIHPVRKPLDVQAMATGDNSVEIWWEKVPNRGQILGYRVSCARW